MKSFSVLCAYNISEYALIKNDAGITPFLKVCTDAAAFPNCGKLLILASPDNKEKISSLLKLVNLNPVEYRLTVLNDFKPHTVFSAAVRFAETDTELEHAFFLYADLPCIDLKLTEKLFENHIEYRAEYSFVDGYPEGLAPEILASGLCKILAEVSKDKTCSDFDIERNFIFETIKKDINNYDIETLIAPADLRHLRLRFASDTKRNSLLCSRFSKINSENYSDLILQNTEALFTLPAYYSLELVPQIEAASIYKPRIPQEKTLMQKEKALSLIEKIANYSDDAVISLSILGEPSLYPGIEEIIEKILSYPKLSVLIETSGLHWTEAVTKKIQAVVSSSSPRKNSMKSIYWIVCIDAVSSLMYAKIHSLKEDEANIKLKQAVTFTDTLNKIFPDSVFAQIVRMNENEIETEPFYRFWKELNVNVIIQKFDTFCNVLEDKRVADLSPLDRNPCWHIKRDMYILSDGSVPLCKEDIYRKNILGNAFTDSFDSIRANAFKIYKEHLTCKYGGLCEFCDEYYTYNF
ncbi:spiro-SPASM protein [Treponema pedis]|uniref:spiro-SPASM protein n=1 Tax=Treponema pedis TaxID=409322 RepID=UPI00197F6C1E|nr:spiro-SPASM protein [Treponema pedis]QSI05363.1 spiro-SPASM protein [Treponema pedis]